MIDYKCVGFTDVNYHELYTLPETYIHVFGVRNDGYWCKVKLVPVSTYVNETNINCIKEQLNLNELPEFIFIEVDSKIFQPIERWSFVNV